jgi:hypothetical protein
MGDETGHPGNILLHFRFLGANSCAPIGAIALSYRGLEVGTSLLVPNRNP